MKAYYRELHRYKYQLMKDYTMPIGLKPVKPIRPELSRFLSLSPEGVLFIGEFYAWDGPSGPTIDTKDFMRGSLVHDALYQLMREKVLDHKKHRKRADEILREICLEDGMCSLRAWYVYKALRIFAGSCARPSKEPKPEVISAP
jgi:hypothetical protein